MLARPVADVTELGVPVRVLPALGDLRVPLQGVALALQQPRHRPVRAGVPRRGQRPRQLAGGLQGPLQRRLRVPPRPGVHHRQQRRDQPRVGGGHRLAAAAVRPRPRLRLPGGLPGAPGHRVRVHPRRRRHHLDPAPAQPIRLRAQHDPPLPLIQVRAHHLVHDRHSLRRPRPVTAHITNDRPSNGTNLIYSFAHA